MRSQEYSVIFRPGLCVPNEFEATSLLEFVNVNVDMSHLRVKCLSECLEVEGAFLIITSSLELMRISIIPRMSEIYS